jgi:hypothetical protein
MKSKLKWIVAGIIVFGVFFFGLVDFDNTMGWIRHLYYRVRGSASGIGSTKPVGNVRNAGICRENLQRIQAGKRKAAQDRGQQVGAITWEEIVRTMPGIPSGRLSSKIINQHIPKCPDGGTYSIGTLEEVPRCAVSGQGTVDASDDHIIRD